ncbi:MAG: glycosyltransferase family 9 protein [Verrucomicrobia bacterium]|nr:glycosyltransferase family 9 protein [Verrucomicrobiota bacterium]
MLVRDDCAQFNGYKPCRPHKETGVHCDVCPQYQPSTYRILILKVGLAGEVLRCTPLLRRLRELHPQADITWVTSFPDFVPGRWVNRLLKHSWETALRLQAEEFDLLLSLDKDFEVCALAGQIRAREKRGFGLNRFGKIIPLDPLAERKWLTGVWDDLMLANTRHYPAEIFEICGYEWRGETYILEGVPTPPRASSRRPLIGLNTGTSNVWLTRIWPEESWMRLARDLHQRGFEVLLLGGPLEHEKNQTMARQTGARYEGVVPFRKFFELVAETDVVVTGVTMAMHVAIALEKPVVLFNNIFNGHEFHLYGKGEILEPGLPCQGCYKPRFDSRCPVPNCMELITTDRVLSAIERWKPQLETAAR